MKTRKVQINEIFLISEHQNNQHGNKKNINRWHDFDHLTNCTQDQLSQVLEGIFYL